jgi:hypothetical protein
MTFEVTLSTAMNRSLKGGRVIDFGEIQAPDCATAVDHAKETAQLRTGEYVTGCMTRRIA